MCSASDARLPLLVAARPGVLRDSLVAFLAATRRVAVVALVDEPAAALEAVRCHQPHTLVVDAGQCEESLLPIVEQLSLELPALNSVVLVSTLGQQRAFLMAGARYVLLKGFLGERLRAAVLDLPRIEDRATVQP